MIRIQNEHLEKLANEHYDLLCNKFKFSISNRLDSSLKEYKSKQEILYKKFVLLLKYLKDNLESIVIGKPNTLEYHREKLIQLSQNFEFTKEEKKKTIEQKKILENLNWIFNYTGFSSSGFSKKKTKKTNKSYSYSGNILVKNLNISVCPYCNRNTIYSINNGQNRTSDLDHYYPQSKYPYFALSFYNLVPSCKVCNQLKSDSDDKECINPYDDRFDMNKNMKFSLKVTSSKFYHSEKGFEIDYRYDEQISDNEKIRIENNLDDFKLRDLYQNHKNIILELIQKEAIYNESYLDELLTQYEGILFKNKEDLQRLISGGYVSDKEIGKRPLSKLIKDISEEIGLLK